jgi:hypothetical protein
MSASKEGFVLSNVAASPTGWSLVRRSSTECVCVCVCVI